MAFPFKTVQWLPGSLRARFINPTGQSHARCHRAGPTASLSSFSSLSLSLIPSGHSELLSLLQTSSPFPPQGLCTFLLTRMLTPHLPFILLILTFPSKYNLSHISRNIFSHLLYYLYILYLMFLILAILLSYLFSISPCF